MDYGMDFDTLLANSKKNFPIPPRLEPIEKPCLPQIQTEMFSLKLNADEYARFALACYEELHPTDTVQLDVKESLGACRRLLRFPGHEEAGVVDWCHVSFIAKPREPYRGSECFFFCELQDIGVGTLSLVRYFKSKPDYSGMARGCGFCPSEPEYPHPRTLVLGSKPVPLDEHSQKEMLKCFELQLNEHKGEKPRGGPPPQLSNHQAAELALELIKEKKFGDFQLEGTDANYCWLGSYYPHRNQKFVQWGHVSFIAKPRPKNGDDDCNDASEKLIFVEMIAFGEETYTLMTHAVLDPHDSRITQGCSHCPPDGHHPHPSIGEYMFGHGESDPLSNLH